MAFFGLFGKKSEASVLAKLAQRAGKKRGQAVDRWEAIRELSQMHSSEAVEALLPRFAFYVDPSITDQEEKDLAFDGIVAAGDAAIAPVLAFLGRSETISWPMKMLQKLVDETVVVDRLIELLEGMDTEYERDPEKKIQIISMLEERQNSRIAGVVARFLDDMNETARFQAVAAILAQPDQSREFGDALLSCLCSEESVRVRNRILEGFHAAGWRIEEDRQAAVKAKLTDAYWLDRKGLVAKKGD